ncbi:ROK family protein [Georgenia subflava]|uniref:ROK family protein n=1 Tax=Georgenia subflava TaxID=1622177 RepID=A0A6N7EFU7_9MICO|nr:ROK family protein [Georgenia subflava]MPV35547.1 ROK family protein [Georgenia subflava]
MTGTNRVSGQCLLGIDFGGTKMAVAVADLDGRVLARRVLPTLAEQGALRALDRALDCATELTTGAGELVAAGIATPGAVDGDRIALAPNVPGWDDLRLGRSVRERLRVERVGVMNDLDAAALAELRHGQLRGADPGLVVGLGTGVAIGVTVRGAVVGGAHHAAGEIGYAPVGSGPLDGTEDILEHVFSGMALDRLGRELGLDGAPGLTASASPVAREAFSARLGALSRQLAAACLLLDPQRVVLVGGMTAAGAVVDGIRDHLRAHVPLPPEVVVSGFPNDAALYGALTLAADLVPVASSHSPADDHRAEGAPAAAPPFAE